MTPFSSVAILEKLALLKIAFCKAPVLSSASSRRTSVTTSTVPAASAEMAGSLDCADIFHPPSAYPDRNSHFSDYKPPGFDISVAQLHYLAESRCGARPASE